MPAAVVYKVNYRFQSYTYLYEIFCNLEKIKFKEIYLFKNHIYSQYFGNIHDVKESVNCLRGAHRRAG